VVVPNGGEAWVMGSVYTIEWGSNPTAVGADVRVGLHKGVDFVDWIVRSTDNDGAYYWKIPATLTAGDDYRVRVQSYTYPDMRDLSDAQFSIDLPPLLLLTPDLHEEWAMGTAHQVTWESNDPGVGSDVRIGLHKGGAFIDWMIRKTDNDGSWQWTVPTGLTPAFSYRLRLQSYTDSNLRTMSPAFTLSAP